MSQRDDEELVSYVMSGLRMMATGFELALEGNQRPWPYSERYLQRRRPKTVVPPAGPPEATHRLIECIDHAVSEQECPMRRC
jgi:hypothetical protein